MTCIGLDVVFLMIIVVVRVFEYLDTENLLHCTCVPLIVLLVVVVVRTIVPIIVQQQILRPLELPGVLALLIIDIVSLIALISQLYGALLGLKLTE